jgi:hypothetical protein
MFVGHDGRLTSENLPAKTKAPVERTLTVAKLSPAEVTEVTEAVARAEERATAAAASFVQVGLYVPLYHSGSTPWLYDCMPPQLDSLCGAFTRDATEPDVNGRSHWSTAEGGHLYYSVNGSWILNTKECSPDTTSCDAYFRTAGARGVPVGEAVWRYHNKHGRSCKCGAFMRTLEGGRLANGRPHWSTAEGGHLYYSINGNWCLNADGLTPDKDDATAWISRAGAVPVGEVVWRYYNGCQIVEQRLAVAKLLPAEAARLRIVGDDASEIRWWEIDGGDVDHLIVEAGCTSTTTIFDHETGDVVDHLSDSLVRRAVYGPWPSCTTISLLKI